MDVHEISDEERMLQDSKQEVSAHMRMRWMTPMTLGSGKKQGFGNKIADVIYAGVQRKIMCVIIKGFTFHEIGGANKAAWS